jgi:hypothetical protein
MGLSTWLFGSLGEGMAAAVGVRLGADPRVTVQHRSFEDFASAVRDGELDLITMVAVLHHLDLDDALSPFLRSRSPSLFMTSGT